MSGLHIKNHNQGQSLLDFIILMSIVAVVFFAMNMGIRRGIQSIIKTAADYVGVQQEAEQDFADERAGYLADSFTTTRVRDDKNTTDFLGTVTYNTVNTTETTTDTLMNLGVVEGSE